MNGGIEKTGCPGKQTGFMSGSFLSGNPHIKYPVLTGKPSPKSYPFIHYLNESIYYVLVTGGNPDILHQGRLFPYSVPFPKDLSGHLFHSVQEILLGYLLCARHYSWIYHSEQDRCSHWHMVERIKDLEAKEWHWKRWWTPQNVSLPFNKIVWSNPLHKDIMNLRDKECEND